ncbi:MAG TPA: class III poly(R)-hydroxyalkanoic acid synthase subunit PhaE [Xanthomonadaceae bacterium]|nr:class III poly(R)-hydroxyalkanoic acid synthase subunit PhaE [Xanthomonadaceae bacterium]
MAEKKTGADWLGDWQALQQRYWTSMGEMARKAADQAGKLRPADMPKWHEGLEIWSRAFQGGRNGHGELVERALAHGKAYLDMIQRVGSLAAQPPGQVGTQDWAATFTEMMKGALPGVGASGFEALRSANIHGARGVEQMMADIEPVLSAFLGEARALLGVQPFGMAREHQERQQALASAVLDYQQASARYQALLTRSLERGIENFEGKLADRSEPGRHIESPKALYDLWIDAAEEGYAEVALSEDFQDAYGALVNTQMRVRQLLQDQVERLTAALGMPTRSEVNSVHRKLAALKRGNVDADALAELQAEVARLRAQLDDGKEPDKTTAKSSKPRTSRKSTVAAGKPSAGKKTATKAKAARPAARSTASNRKPGPSRASAKGAAAARKRKLSR